MTTYKLTTPIVHDNKTITELTLRGMQFGDAEALWGCHNEMQATRILISRLAGVHNDALATLDLVDVAAITELLASQVVSAFGPKQ